MIVLSSGCGQGPTADRIRRDTNDVYHPQRDIHFVERGRRSTGVLVAATPGFDSPFSANWRTVLVPVRPSPLDGPAWSGRKVNGERARAIAALPRHRDVSYLARYGESGRFRFRAPAAWVLGTDPFILGLPAGAPQRTWREFALTATGVNKAQVDGGPLKVWLARLVVEEELNQPLARLVVYPAGFWEADADRLEGMEVAVVTLKEPLPIKDALDAIAAGDPARLGASESVPLREQFASEAEHARAQRADRERLLRD